MLMRGARDARLIGETAGKRRGVSSNPVPTTAVGGQYGSCRCRILDPDNLARHGCWCRRWRRRRCRCRGWATTWIERSLLYPSVRPSIPLCVGAEDINDVIAIKNFRTDAARRLDAVA